MHGCFQNMHCPWPFWSLLLCMVFKMFALKSVYLSILFSMNSLKHHFANYWCSMRFISAIINNGSLPTLPLQLQAKPPVAGYPSDLLPHISHPPEASSAPCTLTTKQMRLRAHLPSWETVAGNCLCSPMTTLLYLAEKVVARICPAQFFLQFQCSKSHSQSPERHIGLDSIWVKGNFSPSHRVIYGKAHSK